MAGLNSPESRHEIELAAVVEARHPFKRLQVSDVLLVHRASLHKLLADPRVSQHPEVRKAVLEIM